MDNKYPFNYHVVVGHTLTIEQTVNTDPSSSLCQTQKFVFLAHWTWGTLRHWCHVLPLPIWVLKTVRQRQFFEVTYFNGVPITYSYMVLSLDDIEGLEISILLNHKIGRFWGQTITCF
jgi:hypothetical protein